MALKDERQANNTREKLRILEDRFEAVRKDPAGNRHTQELTLRSLRRLINQLKEEIARFEARQGQIAT
jgi:DNA repair exonuclease SbcCD ATPase subunit